MTRRQNMPRKLSWQFDDLSKKIQVAPRHLAAKLVLRHLGSSANDSGQSHHGYDSIAAHCSITRCQVPVALKYLRDALGVVTWVKGTGGCVRNQGTNRYVLDLTTMKKLVATQGVFDAETGKRIHSNESADQTSNESVRQTGLRVRTSLLNHAKSTRTSLLKRSNESAQQTVTLIQPSIKTKPEPSVGNEPVSDLSVFDLNQIMLPDGFILRNGKIIQTGGVQ